MTQKRMVDAMAEERVGLKELFSTIIVENEKRFTDRLIDNEKRYIERFESLRALIDLGSSEQKAAVSAAFESQKEAINAALTAAKEAVNSALVAAKEAVIKAEVSAEKRFDLVADRIAALEKQQKEFPPRLEVDAKFEGITKEIVSLREFRSEGGGKDAGMKLVGALVAGILGIAIGAAALIRSFFVR